MLPTTYVYKIYDISNNYLGNLANANIKSDFSLTTDINTAGSGISIQVASNFDVAPLGVQPIEDESGNALVSESGEVITTEGSEQLIGSPSSLIKTGNGIVVWEYSNTYPNGIIVFSGYISQINISTLSNYVTLTCINSGVDLSQYTVRLTNAIDFQTGTSNNASFSVFGGNNDSGSQRISYIFNSTGGTSATNTNGVAILMAAQSSPVTVTVALAEIPDGSSIGLLTNPTYFVRTTTLTISSTTATKYLFTWSPYSYVAGNDYSLTIFSSGASGSGVNVYYQTGASPYGALLRLTNTTYATNSGEVLTADFYFAPNDTRVPFTSTDPSTIVKTALDNYNGDGGVIKYTSSSIAMTGITNFSVTFNVNTILEVIQACQQAAPVNWYWYVDPSNTLWFQPSSVLANHTFVRGLHIKDLDITESIEYIINVSYFTGGVVGGGSNLFVKTTNSNALKTQRRGLTRNSDSRVTLTTSGQILAQSYIDQNSDRKYITKVTILASVYDISTITVGQMVQFRGWGVPYIDTLLLQIMNISRDPHSATLTLGKLLVGQGETVQALNQKLNQTIVSNNPSAPV